MDYEKLLYLSLAIAFLGIFSSALLARKKGYINFIGIYHIWALILMILSGIMIWAAMFLIAAKSNGDGDLKFNNKQLVALISSILIAILVWARYSYVIINDADVSDVQSLKV